MKSLNAVEQERKRGKKMLTFDRVHIPSSHTHLSQDILFTSRLTKPQEEIDTEAPHSLRKGLVRKKKVKKEIYIYVY